MLHLNRNPLCAIFPDIPNPNIAAIPEIIQILLLLRQQLLEPLRNLFHILQASARAEDTGVPAKELTGEAYEGHYFWDTEVYYCHF